MPFQKSCSSSEESGMCTRGGPGWLASPIRRKGVHRAYMGGGSWQGGGSEGRGPGPSRQNDAVWWTGGPQAAKRGTSARGETPAAYEDGSLSCAHYGALCGSRAETA